jgi:hypothetical protein
MIVRGGLALGGAVMWVRRGGVRVGGVRRRGMGTWEGSKGCWMSMWVECMRCNVSFVGSLNLAFFLEREKNTVWWKGEVRSELNTRLESAFTDRGGLFSTQTVYCMFIRSMNAYAHDALFTTSSIYEHKMTRRPPFATT